MNKNSINIPFLLLTPFLCYFSGFFFPIMGFRAAILGFCISAGVSIINILNHESIENHKPPTSTSIFWTGMVTGIIAGILISFISVEPIIDIYVKRHHFDLYFLPPVYAYNLPESIIAGILYNVLILEAYCKPRKSRFLSFALVVVAAMAAYLALAIFPCPTRGDLSSGIIFGAGLFAILWFISAAIADPAFSNRKIPKTMDNK